MLYVAGGESVTVTDKVERDSDGNPISGNGPRTVDGVLFELEGTSTNTAEHGQIPVTNGRALFPDDDPISLGATVTREGGDRWHVVGTPELAVSQIGAMSFGLIVDLVKVGNR